MIQQLECLRGEAVLVGNKPTRNMLVWYNLFAFAVQLIWEDLRYVIQAIVLCLLYDKDRIVHGLHVSFTRSTIRAYATEAKNVYIIYVSG